jgi:hypothetical protein
MNAVKLCVLLSVTMLTGCGGCDYSVDLPNGYRLVRTNSPTIMIFAPDSAPEWLHGLVVPAKITGLNDTNGIVYGRVEQSPDSDMGLTQTPGYFVLDTKTNGVWLGLGEENWRGILKDRGVERPRALVRPSRFYRVHSEQKKRYLTPFSFLTIPRSWVG